jgi:hypothetical protein
VSIVRDGYVAHHLPSHPRANSQGWVLEHLMLVEKALGKALPLGAEVHHVNGDRADNRPGNLVVCQSRAYHMLLHLRQKALAAGCPTHYRRCFLCGNYSDPSTMGYVGRAYYHRARRRQRAEDRSERVLCVICGGQTTRVSQRARHPVCSPECKRQQGRRYAEKRWGVK